MLKQKGGNIQVEEQAKEKAQLTRMLNADLEGNEICGLHSEQLGNNTPIHINKHRQGRVVNLGRISILVRTGEDSSTTVWVMGPSVVVPVRKSTPGKLAHGEITYHSKHEAPEISRWCIGVTD
ncbi:hypothetical protein MKW98_007579 [Papaver atlanticum]|uniref:Uncharacterized protein n=1 Tax=Papaver atlanticum TaxID=357466 RepID=A0AAD4XFH3_9MAGN|nr:hypothetical protein MKW98_007579 [Papaver atlanticum]